MSETSKYQPLKALDVAVKARQTGTSVKLAMTLNSSTPGAFQSGATQRAQGEYDAILAFVTETGASFELTIPLAGKSKLKRERDAAKTH